MEKIEYIIVSKKRKNDFRNIKFPLEVTGYLRDLTYFERIFLLY